MSMAVAAISLILVHGPGGQVIQVNIDGISSIREVTNAVQEHFVAGTRCVILMNSGKFIAVVETCNQVVDMIQDAEK